jgi:hypothetical protein
MPFMEISVNVGLLRSGISFMDSSVFRTYGCVPCDKYADVGRLSFFLLIMLHYIPSCMKQRRGIQVSLDVMLCWVSVSQCSEVSWCFHFQVSSSMEASFPLLWKFKILILFEDQGIVNIWNIENHSPNDTASHPRRPKSLATVLWEPQMSHWSSEFHVH